MATLVVMEMVCIFDMYANSPLVTVREGGDDYY
jgi:hypothetical protein